MGINLVPSLLHSGISSIGLRYLSTRDTTHTGGYCTSPGYLLIIDREHKRHCTHRHQQPAVKSRILIFLAKQFAAPAPICGGRRGSRVLAFLRAYGPSNWYPPPQNGRNNFQYLCLIHPPLTRRRLSSETYFDFLSRAPRKNN